jgi:S-disulfanyl-L-cysteine oxidoreductase SoxD
VRADFKGLPKGQGTVAKGEAVWESKCASCHGTFGESNSVFNPIVGGQKKADIATGRVASLAGDAPERSTLAKLSSLSTLWDYINRAMPWNLPKSLTVEEVYAVTAYVLHLGDVLPADFTLSDSNMAEVQKRIPNRNGMTTNHALWPGAELGKASNLTNPSKPDVQGSACMSNCAVGAKVVSLMPEYALNAHGNLAEQMRGVGATRGMDTSRFGINVAKTGDGNVGNKSPVLSVSKTTIATENKAGSITPMLTKHSCNACHADNAKLVGPSWAEIVKR